MGLAINGLTETIINAAMTVHVVWINQSLCPLW